MLRDQGRTDTRQEEVREGWQGRAGKSAGCWAKIDAGQTGKEKVEVNAGTAQRRSTTGGVD